MTVTYRIWSPVAGYHRADVYAVSRTFDALDPNTIIPGQIVQHIDSAGVSRYRRVEADRVMVPVGRDYADDVCEGCATFEEGPGR